MLLAPEGLDPDVAVGDEKPQILEKRRAGRFESAGSRPAATRIECRFQPEES
jgi:hypothetical protein